MMNNYSSNLDYISHHGILNQKWGQRNGPPYPLRGGDYSKAERTAIFKKRHHRNSIYNKKHFDEVLKKEDTTLSTLSYDKDRLKGADYFYATHINRDKALYGALFNHKITDADGNKTFKWKIDNKLADDMKVASEDSGVKAFSDLYENDRDFYNFVKDPERLRRCFVDSKYGFKGYKEAKKSIEKMDNDNYKPSSDDLAKVYRLWNYVIPNDGGGDSRVAKDVLNQRTKFFNKLKESGYGAVLDTNDAIYGRFKAQSPIIVFDVTQVIPDSIRKTSIYDKRFAEVQLVVNKLLDKVV